MTWYLAKLMNVETDFCTKPLIMNGIEYQLVVGFPAIKFAFDGINIPLDYGQLYYCMNVGKGVQLKASELSEVVMHLYASI